MPFYRKEEFEKLAADNNFYPEKIIAIKQSYKHEYFRYAAIYSRNKPIEINAAFIAIKANQQEYTEEALSLLKDYYLWFYSEK